MEILELKNAVSEIKINLYDERRFSALRNWSVEMT